MSASGITGCPDVWKSTAGHLMLFKACQTNKNKVSVQKSISHIGFKKAFITLFYMWYLKQTTLVKC